MDGNGTQSVVVYPIENIGQKNLFVQLSYVTISTTGILGNIVAIAVIYTSARLRRVAASTLLVSQAVADALTCLLVAVMMLTGDLYTDQGMPDGWRGRILCWLWVSDVFFYASITVSTYNLVMLSVERVVSVTRPMFHRAYMKRRVVGFMVAGAWLMGLGANLAVMMPVTMVIRGRCIDWDVFPSDAHKRAHRMVVFALMYAIPSATIITCYVTIWRSMFTRRRIGAAGDAGVGGAAGGSDGGGAGSGEVSGAGAGGGSGTIKDDGGVWGGCIGGCGKNGGRGKVSEEVAGEGGGVVGGGGGGAGKVVKSFSQREMRSLLKTMLTVVLCYFVCFTPRFVIHVISAWAPKGGGVPISGVEMQFATLIQFSNSAVNPIIYTFQYRPYRQQLTRLLSHVLPDRWLRNNEPARTSITGTSTS